MSLHKEIQKRAAQNQYVDICIFAERVIQQITFVAMTNFDYNDKENLISRFHRIIEDEAGKMYKDMV